MSLPHRTHSEIEMKDDGRSDPTDAELWANLATIQHGFDPEVTRRMVEYFFQRLDEGIDFNERILHQWLHHAFGLIRKGHSAKAAFGFTRQRKRPAALNTERDMAMAASVILCMKNAPQEITDRWEYAVGETANRFFEDGKGDKAVKAAHSKYRDAFSIFSDNELRQILEPSTPIK